MHLPVYFIDSFTSTPFRGNPTAVCIVQEGETPDFFQSVATELNLPVSVFITRKKDSPGEYDIKYFTPTTEIPACGHGTLGAASVVNLEEGLGITRFHTIERVIITARMEKDSSAEAPAKVVQVRMSYPKYDWKAVDPESGILDGLGLKDYKASAFSPELDTLFIEIDSPQTLRSLQPDYAKLTNSSDVIKEVVVTSTSDSPGYDYLLRSFCPWIGIDEDPVTGSVHSVLAGFWKQRLNKNLLKAYQTSQRGGELLIEAGENETGIGGKTVLVLRGEITV